MRTGTGIHVLRHLSHATVIAAALALGGCFLTAAPEVEHTIRHDDKGRVVVTYRICDTSPVLGTEACRIETVVHNYCYRSLAGVDCYENEQPGRTAMQTHRQ